MRLEDLVGLPTVPAPWEEGGKIPWNEPAFSARMLKEHLTQAHDLASRQFETIDRHVHWIDGLLPSRSSRILDLGCGPGFYASRLARLGHECTGLDFSPASIEYAVAEAEGEGLACNYRREDLRTAEFGRDFALVMLIYGELNVFRPEEARSLLEKARAALAPDGLLLLELQPFDAVKRQAESGRSWSVHEEGLFSERPHLVLEETFWDGEAAVGTTRWLVADLSTGDVERHAQSVQAWEDEGLRDLLGECGFPDARTVPSLTGEPDPDNGNLVVWLG